jgi:hypothetical protein
VLIFKTERFVLAIVLTKITAIYVIEVKEKSCDMNSLSIQHPSTQPSYVSCGKADDRYFELKSWHFELFSQK